LRRFGLWRQCVWEPLKRMPWLGGRIIWIGNLFAIDCFDKFA
jgi:hypothetical protein